MMPILVKSDDVRSGRKAKVRHVRLRAEQASMGLCVKFYRVTEKETLLTEK